MSRPKSAKFRHGGNAVTFNSSTERDAFKRAFGKRQYGYEALHDAAAWFSIGYAAKRLRGKR